MKTLSIYESPQDISKPSVFFKNRILIKELGIVLALFCLKRMQSKKYSRNKKLLNLAFYLRCVVLRECNQKSIAEIRNFFELYECHWKIQDSNARVSYESKKVCIQVELPIESDVQIFREFIVSKTHHITKKITCDLIILSNINDFAKFILARIMTFNAQRGGECSSCIIRK